MTTSNPTRSLGRAAAFSALVYVATLFVVPPDGPAVESATSEQIRAFYTENAGALHASALAAAVAAPAIVVFCVCLGRLIASRAVDTVWPSLIVAGGVLIAVWHWVIAAVEANVDVQALDGTRLGSVDDRTLSSWYALTNFGHLFGDLAMSAIALTLTAMCVGSLRSGVLPGWLARAGLVAAAGGGAGVVGVTLGIGPLADAFFVGLFGWVLWIVAAAVLLLVRARRGAVAEPESTSHVSPAAAR